MHRRPRPGDAFVSGIGASALFLFLLHEMYHLADAMVWGLGSDGLRSVRLALYPLFGAQDLAGVAAHAFVNAFVLAALVLLLARRRPSLAILVDKYRYYRRVLRLPPRIAAAKAWWHAGGRGPPTPEPIAYELVGVIRAFPPPIVMLEDDGGALWAVPWPLAELDGRRVRVVVSILDAEGRTAKRRGLLPEGV